MSAATAARKTTRMNRKIGRRLLENLERSEWSLFEFGTESAAESDALAMGWRAYIAPDAEGEIFLFCPECA
jgi:hypothetical protein